MKIAVISGSRADVGPLTPVAEELNADWISAWSPLQNTTKRDAAQSFGFVTNLLLNKLTKNYDMAVLLGDRFETLAAASILNLLGIPIAHLSGGDITEGSQDDAFRHAITKLSHLHFATNEASAKRIVQMGEEPWRVHNVGCPGIDNLLTTELLPEVETRLALLGYASPYYLIAYQPATLAADPVLEAQCLLATLRTLTLPCVFTTLNADVCGKTIEQMIHRFCLEGRGSILEMDSKLYFSAIKYCRVMIGNSSSGLYEAPSLKKAFLNVGDRQKGRLCTSSVVNCPAPFDAQMLIKALNVARNLDCSRTVNPYGDGSAAKRIKEVIFNTEEQLLVKKWKGNAWDMTKFGTPSTQNVVGESTPKKNLFGGPVGHLSGVFDKNWWC